MNLYLFIRENALTLFFILGLTCLCHAQNTRKPDIIVLKNNTKLEVSIQEVEEGIIRYKKLSDPDGLVFTIEKTEVSSILYGNGETENFEENSQVYFDEITMPAPITPYEKVSPKVYLPIKTVREWNSNQLRANYKFYLRKADNYRNMGVIGLIGGVTLTGTGIGIMAALGNGNSYNSLGQFLQGYMIFLVGLGAGVPLTIVGFVNKKRYTRKALLVQDEMRHRKEPFSLNLNPVFDPATQSAGLAVKVSF